jgi:endonuclease III related protein
MIPGCWIHTDFHLRYFSSLDYFQSPFLPQENHFFKILSLGSKISPLLAPGFVLPPGHFSTKINELPMTIPKSWKGSSKMMQPQKSPPGGKRGLKDKLLKIYHLLFAAYGPRHWWPAETPEEVIIGAVLTQNTAWKNVQRAIASLKKAGKMDLRAIAHTRTTKLAELIRSSGFYNQKSQALKIFADYFGQRYGFDLERMRQQDPRELRRELLELYRIGPETADSILLYAMEKPIFVIDAYTKRVFSRHGFLNPGDPYETFQRFFTDHLPRDVKLYNEYHALIVHTGHRFCKPKPLCSECPLFSLFPRGSQGLPGKPLFPLLAPRREK